jgi:hypothetical protein
MPSPAALQQAIETRDGENIIERVAQYLLESPVDGERAREARDFIAALLDEVHGEACFDHSDSMAAGLSPNLIQSRNYLAANIAGVVDEDNDPASLAMMAAARVLEEAYPQPSLRAYSQIFGILTSLIGQTHPGRLELLGALAQWRHYFFRKSTAGGKRAA